MSILGRISDFFHPEKSYQSAQNASQEGWNEAQGYQKPFWQNGLDQYANLFGAENKLLNPAQLQSDWANSYKTSPYANQLLEKNKSSGLDAASSMGLMGSSAALNNIQTGAGNIVNQDRQQYLNDLMQKYMSGIGIGQNIYGIGAQTGANLGKEAQTQGEDMAQLKYDEQNAKNEMSGQLLKTLLSSGSGGGLGGALSGVLSGLGGLGGLVGGLVTSPKTGGAPVSDISQWAS